MNLKKNKSLKTKYTILVSGQSFINHQGKELIIMKSYEETYPKGVHYSITPKQRKDYAMAVSVHRQTKQFVDDIMPINELCKNIKKDGHPDVFHVSTMRHGWLVHRKSIAGGEARHTILGNEDDGVKKKYQKELGIDQWGCIP